MRSAPETLRGADLANWHLLMSIGQPLEPWDWPRIHAAAATLKPAERIAFRWSIQWLKRSLRPNDKPTPYRPLAEKYVIRFYQPLPTNAVELLAAVGFESGVESLRTKILKNNAHSELVDKAIDEVVAEVLEIVIREVWTEDDFSTFDEFVRAALAFGAEVSAIADEFDDMRLWYALLVIQLRASLSEPTDALFAVSPSGRLEVCALVSHFLYANKERLISAITLADD